jgi:transcriptional regulator with XRE-family HTH domain
MIHFGERLQKLRTENKLTQKQLAVQLGLAVSAVSSYESGNRYPTYPTLIKLARLFHVSTDYLLGLDTARQLDISDLDAEATELIVQLAERLKN